MNALDPLLLELILGPDHLYPLIPMLRKHYTKVRDRYPGPFADVEQVWRVQRQWWLEFVLEESGGSGGGPVDVVPESGDVLASHPTAPLHLYSAGRRRPVPAASDAAAGSDSATPGGAGARSRASAAPPPAPRGQTPVPGQLGELPDSGTSDASADPDVPPPSRQVPKASASAATAASSGGGGSPAGDRAVPPSATPVRPRVTNLSGGRRHVPPGLQSRPAGGASASSSAPRKQPSGPPARARVSAAQSPARAGRVSLGGSARALIEAAYVSVERAQALTDTWARSSDDMTDLSDWRIGQQGYLRVRDRLYERAGPTR